MNHRFIIFSIFMAIIQNPTIQAVGCCNKNCGQITNQLNPYKHNYDPKGVCGYPLGLGVICEHERSKLYYKCNHCQTITMANKRMPKEQKEGCSHTNAQIFIQGKILPSGVEIKLVSSRVASTSAPPLEGASEEASSSGEPQMIGGRPFYEFFK
ncbi:hypothetical protein PGT21_028465 [Puccinia graminis f. sp. tritici]|uniref:Uncharacterized protein n=1 Tax=Puccinia graminis f. sp. tritici TaxID=56615 RepID=A0A5B0QBG2_PUCGR|nr:hypothetical protein PGT21_028465 [Puccinia graminis f. sp. tritici]KAA1139311.1 hypothetical protein PGTUg99_037711 [Puccinia graminis f. sp. tritici]